MPLTNPIPPDPNPRRITAPELDEDIKAIPLVAPDFTNPEFKSPDIIGRWIEFKARDGLRYQQALAQGYVPVTLQDLKDPNSLKVYCREAGTKYINGDVILMKIDRRRYLGALRHRFLQSAALSDPAVAQAVAKASAGGQLQQAGAGTKMSAFAPNAADLKDVGLDVSKVPGLGGTPGVEKGTGTDIRAGK